MSRHPTLPAPAEPGWGDPASLLTDSFGEATHKQQDAIRLSDFEILPRKTESRKAFGENSKLICAFVSLGLIQDRGLLSRTTTGAHVA